MLGRFTLKNVSETKRHAQKVAKKLAEKKCRALILVEGELGAGKTEWIRAFCRAYLGKRDLIVTSPTYSLIQPYQWRNKKIWHGDFYRLKSMEEVDGLGLWEWLEEKNIICLEWAHELLETELGKIKNREILLIKLETKSVNSRLLTCQLWSTAQN